VGVSCTQGDIFNVPIVGDAFGIGIVASSHHSELYLVIFRETFRVGTFPNNVSALKPLIASSSLDAKIWHGDWQIIGHTKEVRNIVQPIYKVREPNGWIAESFDESQRFQITQEIASRLSYRKCVAPVRLERALKAHAGHGIWEPDYDELLYTKVLTSRSVFGL